MRVYYHTFGCKANQYDTERMRQELEARGSSKAENASDAEVIVVNTCTVTNQADAEARRFIRRMHRQYPDARMVVAGCSAALRGDDYKAMAGVADVVEGHDAVDVATAVETWNGNGLTQIQLSASVDRIDHEPVGGELLRTRLGAARGWLKIQDGCDRKCSFCATRLARGASRSRPPHEVVAEAALLAKRHAELVLTGIHIGHYGMDLDPPLNLAQLCATLLEAVPDVRFRVGSVEATEVDQLLIELMESSGGSLAPHLHMPLQSGADPVLRLMRRWHTREQYRIRALEIAERISPLGLGADVITGFPGETDDDHAATRALIEEIPFTYLHVFPFSPRKNTVAEGLPAPVPQRIAGERARELRTLAQDQGASYRTWRSGSAATVVVEGKGGSGVTEDYLRVRVDGAFQKLGGWAGTEYTRPWSQPSLVTGILRGEADDLYIVEPKDPAPPST